MAYGIKDYDLSLAPAEAYVENPLRGERALTQDEQTAFEADVARQRDAGSLPDDYIQRAGLRVVNNPSDGSVTLMKSFDDLKLNASEAKWAHEHTSEARDRAYRNGDMDTVALRAMLEFAKANPAHKDARSIDEIKSLAWRLRRNRDISAAKRAAARLQAEGVKDASWEKGYIPTTLAMVRPSTVTEFKAINPSVPWTGMKTRQLPVREAVLMEVNEAAKESGYSPEMRARAAYLAERYGFRPVMQTYDPVVTNGRFLGSRIRSDVSYSFDTGAYRLATPEELSAPGDPAGWSGPNGSFIVMRGNPELRREQNTWNRWAWSGARDPRLVETTFNRKYRRRAR